jgi:transketolase N-terminal domain/subunit
MEDWRKCYHDLICRSQTRLLKMHHESGVGHIGGNLSALDLMVMPHHDALLPSDQFVHSKGHSVGALYVTLWTLGRLTDDDLKSFHKDGTKSSGHPPTHGIEEIPFVTGSLGLFFYSCASVFDVTPLLMDQDSPRSDKHSATPHDFFCLNLRISAL